MRAKGMMPCGADGYFGTRAAALGLIAERIQPAVDCFSRGRDVLSPDRDQVGYPVIGFAATMTFLNWQSTPSVVILRSEPRPTPTQSGRIDVIDGAVPLGRNRYAKEWRQGAL